MKKALATLCLVGSTMALAACETGTGNIETAPPYTMERTASHEKAAPVMAAPVAEPTGDAVFHKSQTK